MFSNNDACGRNGEYIPETGNTKEKSENYGKISKPLLAWAQRYIKLYYVFVLILFQYCHNPN